MQQRRWSEVPVIPYADFQVNSLLSVIGSPPDSMNCRIRVRHSSRKHEWTTEDERDNSLYVSMAERVPEQSQMPLGRECCFSVCCKAMWSDERTRLHGHGEIKDIFLRGSLRAKSKTHYQKKKPQTGGSVWSAEAGWLVEVSSGRRKEQLSRERLEVMCRAALHLGAERGL